MSKQSNLKLVILGLAIVLVLGVVGIIVLAALEVAVPDVLSNLAVGALTALGATLARSDEAEDVRVVNDPTEPVPVDQGLDPTH